MIRSARQLKLIELISKKAIETQEELAALLMDAGYVVTQATISRDIKELGIVKVTYDGKRQKYVREVTDRNVSQKLESIFKNAVVGIDSALNLVVIKTISGSGNTAGMMVDRLEDANILGCVAGDDTVLVIARSTEAAEKIVLGLNAIIGT